jgi:HK97 family phage major capsid protein
MGKRKSAADITKEIEILRTAIFEVEDMEEPTEEDLARSDTALEQIPTLEDELARAVAREDEITRLREAAEDAEATEPADGQDTPAIVRSRRAPGVIAKRDPFDILRSNTRHMGPEEYRRGLADANLAAIERFQLPGGGMETFAGYIQRHGRDASWAQNLLARQRPEYISGWEKIMTGTDVGLLSDVERSAIAVGTNTAGGYLVPTHLDPTLILTNSGVSNVIRGISRQVTLTGGANKWNGVTTAGSTASWDAELTEVSDDTPPVAPAQIPVYSAKGLVMASIESFEDITGLAADVQMLLADARDRLEAAAHATGTGSGQPTGIVPSLSGNGSVLVSLATGHTWTLADLQNVYRSVGVRWRGRGTWLLNPLFLGEIQALGTALSASYTTNLTEPYTNRLLGRPVVESDEMPSTSQTTTIDNLLVYGDFSNYVIVDKPGSTSVEFIPHFFNVANNLPDGRRGWYMHWRNGADSVNDLAFRLLQDKTTA